jgi:hypothetical protein
MKGKWKELGIVTQLHSMSCVRHRMMTEARFYK